MSNSDSIAVSLWAIMLVLLGFLLIMLGYSDRDRRTAQVTLVRKFEACFVIYKDDIEMIPCPPPEKQWQ